MTDGMDPKRIREASRKSKDATLDNSGDGDEAPLSPTKSFYIDTTDKRGTRYEGTFIFHVPTIGDQIEIARMKSVYLPNGGAADVNGNMLTEMICYLEVTLKDPRPGWWQPHQFFDEKPIVELYNKCLEYEAFFRSGGRNANRDDGSVSQDQQDAGGAAESGDRALDGSVPATGQRREVLTANRS